jgi:hypothetical protein
MGQTSIPETLVIHQKLRPGMNQKILSNTVKPVLATFGFFQSHPTYAGGQLTDTYG